MKEDLTEGARPLPWLTPTLVPEGLTLTWTSAGNAKSYVRTETSLSARELLLAENWARHTHLCHNLLLSIANPRVYHSALHSGSDSHK